MTHEIHDDVIRTGTGIFIRKVCETLGAMTETPFTPCIDTPTDSTTPFKHGLTIISHFFGGIQGEYILSTTEYTAARIAGKYTAGASMAAIMAHRETYSELLCEVLNVSAHQAVEDLEKKFGRVTMLPPAWVYGEYHTLDYVSGMCCIKGVHGTIHCSLLLNMAAIARAIPAKALASR
jgi:CheY-specific phosphatase CheX